MSSGVRRSERQRGTTRDCDCLTVFDKWCHKHNIRKEYWRTKGKRKEVKRVRGTRKVRRTGNVLSPKRLTFPGLSQHSKKDTGEKTKKTTYWQFSFDEERNLLYQTHLRRRTIGWGEPFSHTPEERIIGVTEKTRISNNRYIKDHHLTLSAFR